MFSAPNDYFIAIMQINHWWNFHSGNRSEIEEETIVDQQWRHENFHKLEPFGPFCFWSIYNTFLAYGSLTISIFGQ